jgi:p-aminobenzoyl-glutamate transporter AbgT
MHSTTIDNLPYLCIVVRGCNKITLKVLDVYGNMAKTVQTQFEDGMDELMVNIKDLKMGSYVVNAFSGDRFLKAFRFVKND